MGLYWLTMRLMVSSMVSSAGTTLVPPFHRLTRFLKRFNHNTFQPPDFLHPVKKNFSLIAVFKKSHQKRPLPQEAWEKRGAFQAKNWLEGRFVKPSDVKKARSQKLRAHSLVKAGEDQRVWPWPWTIYFQEVSSFRPMGPRACIFCVEMPISAPMPNSAPSVKRVEALI